MTTPSKYRDLSALEMVSVGLFAIAGALVGLVFVIVYFATVALNVMGVQWRWVWE